jgi:hypothetical protein
MVVVVHRVRRDLEAQERARTTAAARVTFIPPIGPAAKNYAADRS